MQPSVYDQIDIQSNALDTLPTRVVIPLVRASLFKKVGDVADFHKFKGQVPRETRLRPLPPLEQVGRVLQPCPINHVHRCP